MRPYIPVYCGEEAIAHLTRYCQSHQVNRFLLVSDQNTYAALGQEVEASLKEHGEDVRTVVLSGAEVIADEKRIFEVLLQAGDEERMYLAVGSGTITDITRFASHRTRNAFISLPTAPSVDAYTSGVSSLVAGGFKRVVPGHGPVAIFADLRTLCEAPHGMIAAGFGDVLGKHTALADWRLGALLLDESYSAEIAGRLRQALQDCVENVEEIGEASTTGVLRLMEGLLETGFCMLEFGSSRPASGAEHLLSHFWEIKLLREERPPILHGTKVGVGTVLAAQRYEAIRSLTHKDVVDRLSTASLPGREEEVDCIRTGYGAVADQIIAAYQPFLAMMEAKTDTLKQNIRDHWGKVQEIAASVPSSREIADLLEQVGGPSDPQAIGLAEEEVQQALRFSGYLRNRFTVNTLGRVLGVW